MSTAVNNEATILTSTRHGRTIEIDDMSLLDGGMTDTYVVYEDNALVCDFMMSTPWGRIPGSIEDMAWVALEEAEAEDE